VSCGPSLSDLLVSLFGSCGCGGLGQYAKTKAATIRVDATALAPFELPFEGISEVQLLAIRSSQGSVILVGMDTTDGGVSQLVPVDDLLILRVRADAASVTAIDLSGTGEVEYVIAGA